MAPTLSRQAKELAEEIIRDGIDLFRTKYPYKGKEMEKKRYLFGDGRWHRVLPNRIFIGGCEELEIVEDRATGHCFEYFTENWNDDVREWKDCEGEYVLYRRLMYNQIVKKYGDGDIIKQLGHFLRAFDEGIAADRSCKCPTCAGEASPEWEEYINADKYDENDSYFSAQEGYVYIRCEGYWYNYWCNDYYSSDDDSDDDDVSESLRNWRREQPWDPSDAFLIARQLLNLLADTNIGEFWDMTSSDSSVQTLIIDWDEALLSKLRGQ